MLQISFETHQDDRCGDFVCDNNENPLTCGSDCKAVILKAQDKTDSISRGQMFTIEAIRELTVFAFDVVGKKKSLCQVYTKSGGYKGYENDSRSWNLVFGKQVQMTNDFHSTLGPLKPEVTIPAGSTQAFHVWCKEGILYKKTKYENVPFHSDGSLMINSGNNNVGGNGKYSGWIRYYSSATLV
mmetsp:Transcript_16026/g.34907  ORF Transcript_16026/g.34907 Transcript_16026/m.34907 type:complete len:184 (-) Transcript_16026:215-766(-)